MTDFLVVEPDGPRVATLILAHGAGAPMDSDFMNALSRALATRGIATLRFEFPYMRRRRLEQRKLPPDRPQVLLDCWRQVFAEVRGSVTTGEPLLIGGKSMGGRLATLVAEEVQPEGFCCFGYPFYPPGNRSHERSVHFAALSVPGLILQGTRDSFGKPDEIDTSTWAPDVRLVWLDEGDHDYRARKSAGVDQAGIIARAAAEVAGFAAGL